MTEIRTTSEITVTPIRILGDDQFVVGAMKTLEDVPPPDQSDRGRIRYLMQHRHGTPFEHNCIILHVHAPIFVWREWHRHRIGWSYNEGSARYKKLDPVFFVPARDRPMIKIPDEKWKPARPKFWTLDQHREYILELSKDMNPGERNSMDPFANGMTADRKYEIIVSDMEEGYRDEYERYERQLSRYLDPGLARDNLPVGIFSSCWVTCNLRSALAFLSLRTHDSAAKYISYPLWEIEQGARQLEGEVAKAFPLVYEAFCEFGRVGP